MDYIVATARRYGIKLIATLANNWPDYGECRDHSDLLVFFYVPHTTSPLRGRFVSAQVASTTTSKTANPNSAS